MNCTASRRAGASLFTVLTAPSCRATERHVCRRLGPLQYRRTVAAGTTTRQTPSTAPTSSKPATHPRPVPSAPASAATVKKPAPAAASAPQKPPAQPGTAPAAPALAEAENGPHDLVPSSEPEVWRSLTAGLDDSPPVLDENEKQVDWTRSYHGMSSSPFTAEQANILQQELSHDDIEIKPDGIIYLPEIKYRRILNKAFGPGGWGLIPRGQTTLTPKLVTREYGLVCGGRLVSVARGEQQYFDPNGIATATEGCKSNALMRCCKDLGIASELWDPRYIRRFMEAAAKETMVEHVVTRKRRKHWMRKDDVVRYPFKEVPLTGGAKTVPAGKN